MASKTEVLSDEFSRRSFVKGGGALIVGLAGGAPLLAASAREQLRAPTRAPGRCP